MAKAKTDGAGKLRETGREIVRMGRWLQRVADGSELVTIGTNGRSKMLTDRDMGRAAAKVLKRFREAFCFE